MTKLLIVRMKEDVLSLVRDVSAKRGEHISTFVRRSVMKELARLSYLSAEEKKALGDL